MHMKALNIQQKSIVLYKGVTGRPSGPSREGPGVGHKTDDKGKKKEKKSGKREKCAKKKKMEERERQK